MASGKDVKQEYVFIMGFSFEGVTGTKVSVDLVKDPTDGAEFIALNAAESSIAIPLECGPLLQEVLAMLLFAADNRGGKRKE